MSSLNHKPLQVIYFCADGEAVSDFDTASRTLEFVKSNRIHWRVSTANVIHQVRALIALSVIKHTDVLFYFEERFYIAQYNGFQPGWPRGLADLFDVQLDMILDKKWVGK